MVEIRVVVTDATRVHGLMRRLGGVFDGSAVSFDGTRGEVQVRSEWESRSLVQVLGAVESWLAEDGPESAKLSVGDRSYTMVADGTRSTERAGRMTPLTPQLVPARDRVLG